MVVCIEGKNRIRDLIVADKYEGELGTDSTAETEDDTALGSAGAGTNVALTSTTAEKAFSLNYNLGAGSGNSVTYREFGLELNSGTDFFSRVTFAALSKTSSEEFQISSLFYIE